jgi:ribosomal protein S18 acetylase RimI-like enzyme
MNYNFRKANTSDLDQILKIVEDAKQYLKESGSNQWNGPTGYPNIIDFKLDIENNNLYVLTSSNKVIGFEALIIGIDENYLEIDGNWLTNSNNYMSIHRIAISKEYRNKHIAKYLIQNAINLAINLNLDALRGDTHKLNIPMQKLFLSQNFKHCGTIKIISTTIDNLRLAYEYVIKK